MTRNCAVGKYQSPGLFRRCGRYIAGTTVGGLVGRIVWPATVWFVGALLLAGSLLVTLLMRGTGVRANQRPVVPVAEDTPCQANWPQMRIVFPHSYGPWGGVETAALACPKPGSLSGRGRWIKPHVTGERRPHRAAGSAIDPGGQHRGDKPAVEPGVLGLDGAVAAFGIVVHASRLTPAHRQNWRKNDVVVGGCSCRTVRTQSEGARQEGPCYLTGTRSSVRASSARSSSSLPFVSGPSR
jgi:hypothetical protein